MPPSSWVREVKAQYSRTPEPGCTALHCSHNSSSRAGVQLNGELLSSSQEALGFVSAPQERGREREKGWEPGRKRGRKKRRERGKERRKRGRGKRVTCSVLGRPTDGYIFSDSRNRLPVLQCPSNRTSVQSFPACSIQRTCHRDRSRVTPIGYRHGMTVHSLGTWPVLTTVSNCPPLSSLPPMTRV